MSIIMEVSKRGDSPTLIMKEDYNSLGFSEKLQCLESIRTAIEKEIAYTESDLGRLFHNHRFM
tara:strand:- start:595 stop:783 length:189 start_codon:yes stop_codon:yes gene_type:complete